jgi:imidazolonepropionase
VTSPSLSSPAGAPARTRAGDLVVVGIGQLVTFAPLAEAQRWTGLTEDDLGALGPDAYVGIAGGKVTQVGRGPLPASLASLPRLDARGGLVVPGLVDAHTHAIFGGSRAHEFAQRLAGATYQEIAARGGGILSTMRATRGASDAELIAGLERRIARAASLGVTTLEVKSGYGLSVAEELRLLRLLAKARAEAQVTLEVTCLALHAASPEHPTLAAYVDACVRELLPAVAAEGLAQWADAFIERGYFGVGDVAPYAAKARALGLGLRLHADEFSDAGATGAAAAWGAASADHDQFASDAGIEAMAAAGTVATLLPGTSLYTAIPFADAKRFKRRGVPVALATDFNPGSCLVDNLALVAGLGAVHCGLTPVEALAAVTFVAARSLRLEARKGALVPGYDGDLAVYADLPDASHWLADFGRTPPSAVVAGGARVAGAS